MIIEMNVDHPFYKKIIIPLYGNQENNEKTVTAILLLLASYAKAASKFPEKDLIEKLEEEWGVVLGAVIRRL